MPSNKQPAAAAPINWSGWSEKLAKMKPAEAAAQISNAIILLERGALQVGMALMDLHERFARNKTGIFEKTLDDVGLSARAARRYMLIAKRFGAHVDKELPLLSIGVSKLAVLAGALSDEEAGQLAAEGRVGDLTYEAIENKSTRQLELDIRDRKSAFEFKANQNFNLYQNERNAHEKTREALRAAKRQQAEREREPWRLLPPELLTALNNAEAALAVVVAVVAEAEKSGAPAQTAMADQCAAALKNFRNKTLNKRLGAAASKVGQWARAANFKGDCGTGRNGNFEGPRHYVVELNTGRK